MLISSLVVCSGCIDMTHSLDTSKPKMKMDMNAVEEITVQKILAARYYIAGCWIPSTEMRQVY